MTHQVFTCKGMLPIEQLTRSVVWEFTHEHIIFKEQYHENATGELVKSGCDVYLIPKEQTTATQGALNG